MKLVSQPALQEGVVGCLIWTRYESRSEADVVIDPQPKHVNMLLESKANA